ncbi:MAG: hypothetical protein FWG81_06360 [Betaproteobacteria bacterium]|nr:hypothetical protein [Betaproteobacteria bacterium]
MNDSFRRDTRRLGANDPNATPFYTNGLTFRQLVEGWGMTDDPNFKQSVKELDVDDPPGTDGPTMQQVRETLDMNAPIIKRLVEEAVEGLDMNDSFVKPNVILLLMACMLRATENPGATLDMNDPGIEGIVKILERHRKFKANEATNRVWGWVLALLVFLFIISYLLF